MRRSAQGARCSIWIVRGALLGALALSLVACDTTQWDTVATQAISHGVVGIWAPEGRLRAGTNRLVVEITGPAADRIQVPPRLTFEKRQSAAGFGLHAEAPLRPAGRARYAGEVELPEPGVWNGRLEIQGEVVAITVGVE